VLKKSKKGWLVSFVGFEGDRPQVLDPKPQTPNLKLYSLNPIFYTLCPKPYP
jgi:hypothetical protein